jgi:fructuronate reductase
LFDQTSPVTILSNESIFGVNLYEISIGEKIEGVFHEMLTGPGAVRRTLEKYRVMKNCFSSF